MLPKPSACQGCPMYQTGQGFVPDEIVPGARVNVDLQNPGSKEERDGKPAVGFTGDILNDTLLPAAGLARGGVNVRNVIRCRWQGTNTMPPAAVLSKAIQHCRVHDQPTNAVVTVACGSHAWKAHGGPGTVTAWRGFPHPERPVLATLHPADLMPGRNPKMKLAVLRDWSKVPGMLKGTWPQPLPPFHVIRGGSGDFASWCQQAAGIVPFVVIDTEYDPATKWLQTLGIGGPGIDGRQVWFSEHVRAVDRSDIRQALLGLVARVPVVFQNAMADIPILGRNLGIKYADYCRVEDTMLAHAVLWSEWEHGLEYLASIYGQHHKMKHLSKVDPERYNWGDVVDTISVWQGLQPELRRDPASEAIYRDQSLKLVPVILKRAERGLLVNREAVNRHYQHYSAKLAAATTLAHAGVGWPINIASQPQMLKYLYETRKYPKQLDKEKKLSVGGDAIAALRRHVGPEPDLEEEARDGLSLEAVAGRLGAGADPILEARVLYTESQQVLSHFLNPLADDRVYPSVKIHAQASGRWSITDPPLQQFPAAIQECLIPDPGEVWVGWDWDQIELRLLAALARDESYLEAFAQGWDIHTLNACAIFGLPDPTDKRTPWTDERFIAAAKWTGKDDIRRTFAKRFVYRLNYGGDPQMAGDIPGARQLGLSKRGLVAASQRYLAAHPDMAAWRLVAANDAKASRVSRTFMGRRRRLLGEGQGIVREAYNHPMQGGVADILNVSVIKIAEALPQATLAYTVHDAAWWAVPQGQEQHAKEVIHSIITAPWDIAGVKLAIPAKFKEDRIG